MGLLSRIFKKSNPVKEAGLVTLFRLLIRYSHNKVRRHRTLAFVVSRFFEEYRFSTEPQLVLYLSTI